MQGAGDRMKTILAETWDRLTTRLSLGLWGMASFLLAVGGPFGTYEERGPIERLVYWALVLAVATSLAFVIFIGVRRLVDPRRPVLVTGCAVAVMTLTFTPILWVLTYGLSPLGGSGDPSLLRLAVYVVLVTTVVSGLRTMLFSAPEPAQEETAVQPEARAMSDPEPVLSRRLPEDFEPPILRLGVRDHLVEVVSARSACQLRMRFADAVHEMDGVAGYCTHRSHWVSVRAIAGVEHQGSRVALRLSNGDLVPVSRTYRPVLEDAGIIERSAPDAASEPRKRLAR